MSPSRKRANREALIREIVNPTGKNVARIAERSKGLLSDSESLRLLALLIRQHSRRYRDAADKLSQLPDNKEIVALLDFDVIYSYITAADRGRKRQLEVLHFFEVSETKYKIPEGTYKELCVFLGAYHEFKAFAGKDLSAEKMLSIVSEIRKGFPSSDTYRFLSTDDSRFASSLLVVERLAKLLSDTKRFLGRWVGYSDRDFDLFYSLLEQETLSRADRHLPKERELSNRRLDAVNLACVLQANRQSDAFHHFLLTLTDPVHKAAGRYETNSRQSDGTTIVAWPGDIVWIDLSEFHRSSPFARSSLRATVQQLDQLERLFVERTFAIENNQEVLEEESIVRQLVKVAEDENSFLINAEQNLSAFQIAEKYRRLSFQKADGMVEDPYFSFLRSISAISWALHQQTGRDYVIEQSTNLKGAGGTYLIKDPTSIAGEVICCLRFYSPPLANWTIVFDSEGDIPTFVSMLLEANVISEFKDAEPSGEFTDVVVNPAKFSSGIIVQYSIGTIGFQGQIFNERKFSSLSFLSLGSLTRFAVKNLVPKKLGRSGAMFPTVEAIRIVCESVEIIFDLVPRPLSFIRKVTIHGKGPIGDLALSLVQALGLSVVSRRPLQRAFENVERKLEISVPSDLERRVVND